jgi:hypothetical protein
MANIDEFRSEHPNPCASLQELPVPADCEAETVTYGVREVDDQFTTCQATPHQPVHPYHPANPAYTSQPTQHQPTHTTPANPSTWNAGYSNR